MSPQDLPVVRCPHTSTILSHQGQKRWLGALGAQGEYGVALWVKPDLSPHVKVIAIQS